MKNQIKAASVVLGITAMLFAFNNCQGSGGGSDEAADLDGLTTSAPDESNQSAPDESNQVEALSTYNVVPSGIEVSTGGQMTLDSSFTSIIDFEFSEEGDTENVYYPPSHFYQHRIKLENLRLSQVAGAKLLVKIDDDPSIGLPGMPARSSWHEPYSDNACSVSLSENSNANQPVVLAEIVCSNVQSQDAGGYIMGKTARLILDLAPVESQSVIAKDLALRVEHSGVMRGRTLILSNVPIESVASASVMFTEEVEDPYDGNTRKMVTPFADNLCKVHVNRMLSPVKQLANQLQVNVICKSAQSKLAGGMVLPSKARVNIQLKDTQQAGLPKVIALPVSWTSSEDIWKKNQAHVVLPEDVKFEDVVDANVIFKADRVINGVNKQMAVIQENHVESCFITGESLSQAGALIQVFCEPKTDDARRALEAGQVELIVRTRL